MNLARPLCLLSECETLVENDVSVVNWPDIGTLQCMHGTYWLGASQVANETGNDIEDG